MAQPRRAERVGPTADSPYYWAGPFPRDDCLQWGTDAMHASFYHSGMLGTLEIHSQPPYHVAHGGSPMSRRALVARSGSTCARALADAHFPFGHAGRRPGGAGRSEQHTLPRPDGGSSPGETRGDNAGPRPLGQALGTGPAVGRGEPKARLAGRWHTDRTISERVQTMRERYQCDLDTFWREILFEGAPKTPSRPIEWRSARAPAARSRHCPAADLAREKAAVHEEFQSLACWSFSVFPTRRPRGGPHDCA
jgi:hypothetical protein